MFLKAIEIKGFKSFADKTELIFTGGITSIVGPNGSGKSNISDAVRWVLGEQSVKNLRGGKMEDVIFAGTQFRKSLGLCQVSLTLDNEDKKLSLEYSNITVSRRLYRSGESEYYINNVQCRLKDIHELFMDTGIGREGYSIIGQGRIDALLSGKQEDRRLVLEEAAGIVKFKWRRGEAEKKLQNTEVNLIRIEDILKTYEERLKPLEQENKKASEFLRLSEELKEKEITILVHSLKKVQYKVDKLEKSIKDITNSNAELNEELAKLKYNINSYNAQIENINGKNAKYKENYYDKKEKIQQTENEIRLLKQKIEDLKGNVKRNYLELKQMEYDKDKKLEKVNLQNQNLLKLESKEKEVTSSILDYENSIKKIEYNISGKENLYKKLKDDKIKYFNHISNLKNNIVSIKKDIESMLERVKNIQGSCESYNKCIETNSVNKEKLLIRISDIKNHISSNEKKIDENNKEILKLNNIFQGKERELQKLSGEYNRLEANYTMLVNFHKHYEGYNRAVKILMERIKSHKLDIPEKSCFLVGEVISLHEKFETCIEISLGNNISSVITKDEIVAKTLIEYLKKNNIGRATFLPISTVKGRRTLNVRRFEKIKGYIGVASELVSYNEEFKDVLNYILGRTIICENIDNAFQIAKLGEYSFRIVTLSGDVVNSGGAITGGSLEKRSSNIIGRKREIEETLAKIKNITQTLTVLNENIKKCKEDMNILDKENVTLKEEVYLKNIELTKLQQENNTLEKETKKLIENKKIANKEIYVINENKKLSLKKLKEEEEKLNNYCKDELENNGYILKIEEELKDSREHITNFKEELMNLKVKKAQISESILNGKSESARLTSEIEETDAKKHTVDEEIKICEKNIHKNQLDINLNEEEIKDLKQKIEISQRDIEESNLMIIKLKQKINNSNEQIEILNLSINKKETSLHKIQLTLTRLISQKDNIHLKLQEDIKITYDEAMQYDREIENLEEYNSEIVRLKNSISRLGIVNLGAIEEYKNLEEKVAFLHAQKGDLVKSKQELKKVIDAMTEKMKGVFKENFSKLKINFNYTFRELFKGGSADLILTKGDELTGNIDIAVQPPGKKLKNINLMSGGEKGLSAIALLFAILKIKPTPFCILDEIEASLDDANVLRYAQFLKRFSKDTQFIVITHRKGTMEVSDILYGVTMEEKGVSKIVSLKLKQSS
ncbi:chromosome segregation protein SMC [Clostridium sp. WILCCON 0269]|uniref:Chromosome partition protein Smc n=1 Tax=Candidatus Clostridium eludens TaxID=3381663 RepID=A0ABW8SL69_9CLOT